MTSLSDVLLPGGFLVHCLNAALASLAVCAVALALSRFAAWPLPVRHALLAVALTASLAAPLVIPLLQLPSFWTIQVSDAADVSEPGEPALPPADANPSRGKPANVQHEHVPLEPAPAPADATSIPHAAAGDEPPKAVAPEVSPPVSAGSKVVSSASIHKQRIEDEDRRTTAATPWMRIVGTLLCGLWLAGIAVCILRALLGIIRLRRWLQTVSVAESPALMAAARSAAEGMGLRRAIPIYRSTVLPAPVSFGLLRPRIVVPTGIESSLSSDQLQAVIKHELAHIARRDLWIGLLQEVAQIVYWWNPLVRLAGRQLADVREQICDDIAIGGMARPADFAATLLDIAERSGRFAPLPGTLGVGSSPARQLESRIRRIVSPPGPRCLHLSRAGAAGVSAAAVLMTATMLLAQVQIKPPGAERFGSKQQSAPKQQAGNADEKAPPRPSEEADNPPDPSLHELIQHMAAWERAYLPFDIESMETFRVSDDLTPQERARLPWADGRKHQRLMEYAQLEKRIWRKKETDLIDDEVEQGPYEQFSDGERIVQASPSSISINGKAPLEIYINNKKNQIFTWLNATPLYGAFCLSTYGASELFSEEYKDNEDALELAWDNGDAKLTIPFKKQSWNMRYVLWLSRAHDWHPVRLQRYMDVTHKVFFDEWEATKFVRRGNLWRVVEGTHRYRDSKELKSPDAKIRYSVDFQVLAEKYGSAVDEKQFHYEIPKGVAVHDDSKPEAEPPPPAKTREIKVTVVDVAGQPVPGATVRIPASRLRDLDVVATDENGVARSAKAPEGNATVQITAPGCRPVTWIMGNVDELRAIVTPQTAGAAVDEQGHPVAGAWIPSRPPQFRADGFVWFPDREFRGDLEDWSDGEGRFQLKTELTLRSLKQPVALIAVDPNRERMAIRIVAAGELGQQQKLVLRPVCHVHGHCLLEGMTQTADIMPSVETAAGETVGSATTRRQLTPNGLRVDFQLRLPPGDYVLKSLASSHHAGFAIPIAIPADKDDLDLETTTVSATGAVALQGKPAPALDVQWRAGQETTWAKLRGKVVVLDFWGTWCVPCVAQMPDLMDVAEQFRDKPVAWLSIHTPNLEDFDELDRQIAQCEERNWNKRKLPFTTVIDRPLPEGVYSGKTSQRYGVAEWPTLIVVDPQGKVVGPLQKGKLAETINRLLEANAK